jgi:hypothetical protein
MADNLQALQNALQIALDTAVMTETALRGTNLNTVGPELRRYTIPKLKALLESPEVSGSLPTLRRILESSG